MSRPVTELLEGAIDMHVHPLAEGFSVPMALETARGMADAGMAGVLFKPHFNPTAMVAELLDEVVPELQVWGGHIMERSAGGIDPRVVASQLRDGAVKVWMPLMTRSFWDAQRSHPRGYLGEEAMARMRERHGPFWEYMEDGELRSGLFPELREVLELIADAGAIFDTGHASAEASLALVEEAVDAGVEKVVVDHPLAITKDATIEQHREMVAAGAYVEQSWAKLQPTGGGVPAERYAEAIEAVGAENTVLVSDYAAGDHPPAPEAMREYFGTLREHGISDAQLRVMTRDNPRDLLGV
jgi:hypothetical protein